MSRWIDSLGPKWTIIGLFQKTNMMKNLRTGEDLYTMVNSVHRPSRKNERQRRHAPSMQALPSLMEFLGNERQRYPSSPKGINSVRIGSTMECGTSSPFQTHAIKRRDGIFFYINLDFHWTMSKAMYRVFWKALRRISMLFRIWRGQECIWGVIYQILFFRRYWHWCRCTTICNVLPWITFQFKTLHMIQSILQRIIRIREKCSHIGDKELRSVCCLRHQCQYLLKKSVW